MDIKILKSKLANYRKGTFVQIKYVSDIAKESAKKQGISAYKEVTAVVRVGISYSHLASQIEKKKNAQSEPVKVFKPWFEHLPDNPAIIRALKDGKEYLQVFPSKKNKSKVIYYLNGKVASRDDIMNSGYCKADAFASTEKPELLSIKLENIKSLGR